MAPTRPHSPPAQPVPGAGPPAPSCAQHTRPLTPRAQSHHPGQAPGEPRAPRTRRVPHGAPCALRIHHEPRGRAKNPTSTSRTPQECHMPHGYVICPMAVSHPTDRSQSAQLHLVPHSSATHPTGPSCAPQTSHVPHRHPTGQMDTHSSIMHPTEVPRAPQLHHAPHRRAMHPTASPCLPGELRAPHAAPHPTEG